MKGHGQSWLPSRLVRDIAIVVAVKVLALIIIKLAWFSDPPSPNITEALLGPASVQTR